MIVKGLMKGKREQLAERLEQVVEGKNGGGDKTWKVFVSDWGEGPCAQNGSQKRSQLFVFM